MVQKKRPATECYACSQKGRVRCKCGPGHSEYGSPLSLTDLEDSGCEDTGDGDFTLPSLSVASCASPVLDLHHLGTISSTSTFHKTHSLDSTSPLPFQKHHPISLTPSENPQSAIMNLPSNRIEDCPILGQQQTVDGLEEAIIAYNFTPSALSAIPTEYNSDMSQYSPATSDSHGFTHSPHSIVDASSRTGMSEAAQIWPSSTQIIATDITHHSTTPESAYSPYATESLKPLAKNEALPVFSRVQGVLEGKGKEASTQHHTNSSKTTALARTLTDISESALNSAADPSRRRRDLEHSQVESKNRTHKSEQPQRARTANTASSSHASTSRRYSPKEASTSTETSVPATRRSSSKESAKTAFLVTAEGHGSVLQARPATDIKTTTYSNPFMSASSEQSSSSSAIATTWIDPIPGGTTEYSVTTGDLINSGDSATNQSSSIPEPRFVIRKGNKIQILTEEDAIRQQKIDGILARNKVRVKKQKQAAREERERQEANYSTEGKSYEDRMAEASVRVVTRVRNLQRALSRSRVREPRAPRDEPLSTSEGITETKTSRPKSERRTRSKSRGRATRSSRDQSTATGERTTNVKDTRSKTEKPFSKSQSRAIQLSGEQSTTASEPIAREDMSRSKTKKRARSKSQGRTTELPGEQPTTTAQVTFEMRQPIYLPKSRPGVHNRHMFSEAPSYEYLPRAKPLPDFTSRPNSRSRAALIQSSKPPSMRSSNPQALPGSLHATNLSSQNQEHQKQLHPIQPSNPSAGSSSTSAQPTTSRIFSSGVEFIREGPSPGNPWMEDTRPIVQAVTRSSVFSSAKPIGSQTSATETTSVYATKTAARANPQSHASSARDNAYTAGSSATARSSRALFPLYDEHQQARVLARYKGQGKWKPKAPSTVTSSVGSEHKPYTQRWLDGVTEREGGDMGAVFDPETGKTIPKRLSPTVDAEEAAFIADSLPETASTTPQSTPPRDIGQFFRPQKVTDNHQGQSYPNCETAKSGYKTLSRVGKLKSLVNSGVATLRKSVSRLSFLEEAPSLDTSQTQSQNEVKKSRKPQQPQRLFNPPVNQFHPAPFSSHPSDTNEDAHLPIFTSPKSFRNLQLVPNTPEPFAIPGPTITEGQEEYCQEKQQWDQQCREYALRAAAPSGQFTPMDYEYETEGVVNEAADGDVDVYADSEDDDTLESISNWGVDRSNPVSSWSDDDTESSPRPSSSGTKEVHAASPPSPPRNPTLTYRQAKGKGLVDPVTGERLDIPLPDSWRHTQTGAAQQRPLGSGFVSRPNESIYGPESRYTILGKPIGGPSWKIGAQSQASSSFNDGQSTERWVVGSTAARNGKVSTFGPHARLANTTSNIGSLTPSQYPQFSNINDYGESTGQLGLGSKAAGKAKAGTFGPQSRLDDTASNITKFTLQHDPQPPTSASSPTRSDWKPKYGLGSKARKSSSHVPPVIKPAPLDPHLPTGLDGLPLPPSEENTNKKRIWKVYDEKKAREEEERKRAEEEERPKELTDGVNGNLPGSWLW